MAQKKTFENALKQLEKIVEDLESGQMPLEKAIQKFEEGMALSKFCNKKLDETEKKISVLVKGDDQQLIEKPFEDA